jgi:hypothetical protein
MPSTPSGTFVTFAQLNEFARRYAAPLTAQASLTAEPLRELITEDVHWADPLLPQPLVGAQAVLDFTLTNFHTFPDLVCEIPDLLAPVGHDEGGAAQRRSRHRQVRVGGGHGPLGVS